MRLRPRQGLLAGIAALAAGSVVLEIALARTLTALLGQHLALAAPMLAPFGAGLGGALYASLPELARKRSLLARMAYLSGLAVASTLAALLVVVHVRVPDALGGPALGPLAAILATSALPFLFVGVALAAAVRHVSGLSGRIVFAVFSGVALGGPAALGAVRAGALRAGLVALIVYALAALFFYLGAASPETRERGELQRPRGALVAVFLLAGVVLLAGDVGAPWLKLPLLRFTPLDKAELQEWSALGLVTVDKAASGISWMHTDGTSSVPIYEAKTTVPVGPGEMAYVLHHERGPVAVVGGGGGREVRTALKYGQREVVVVDLDPVAVREVMQGRYDKASGEVYASPQVTVAVDAGRGYVRRAGKAFRNIELALPEGQAASTAGVLAIAPNDLYTVDAFADLFSQLAPEGTLVASRLDTEADRLLALAAASLERVGVDTPAKHLYACNAAHVTTVLAAKTPLDPHEVLLLRKFCSKSNKLVEAFAPDQPHTEQRRRLAEAPDAAPSTPVDLRVPDGDRPFFSLLIAADQVPTALGAPKAGANAQGLVVLAALLGVAAVLVFLTVGMPLAAWPRSPVGRSGPLLFFAALGAAIAFAFAALLPRLCALLGHPLYAYTTVIPAFFAAMGVGGLLMARTRTGRSPGVIASAGLRAELLVAALAVSAVGLGPLVDAGVALPFGARFLAACVPLVPVGVLAGSLLALGVKLVAARSPALLPWCWGMVGVGACVAVAAAGPVVLLLGYSVALLAAGASALAAAVCVPWGR